MRLKKRRVSKDKIRRIGEILEEFLIGNFESEFPVGGPSGKSQGAANPELPLTAPSGELIEVIEPEGDDVDDEQVDEEAEDAAYDETKYYFDLADVEYSVSVAITEIINEKLVPGYYNPRKPPTLSEIFQVVFDEDHTLTKQVDEFEEYISGYDDNVHIDDLRAAYNVMSEIVKELKDWDGKQSD